MNNHSDATASYPVVHYARTAMASLAGMMPVSAVAFYQVDSAGNPHHYLLYRMPESVHASYLASYQRYDPLHPARAGIRQAVLPVGEVLPHEQRQQSRYGRFMSYHDMNDVVELFVRRQERIVAGFSLIRSSRLGHFADREITTLKHAHGLLEMAAVAHLPLQAAVGEAQPSTGLTPREQQVLALLRQGACNKTIARVLNMGLPTVKTHLQHVYRKYGVNNRTELVSQLFLLSAGTEHGFSAA